MGKRRKGMCYGVDRQGGARMLLDYWGSSGCIVAAFLIFGLLGHPADRVVAEPEGSMLAFQGKLSLFPFGSEVFYPG